jgi:LysR family transcriptional regulator, benzoate and cis,cis-muconate-responsive activator of ben and cat genes
MVVDFRQLRHFLAVANARSFSRAAEQLNIAQPPLSRTVRQLEGEVGGLLFDRSARPLAVTPLGQLLYEQARQITDRMDDMHAMMRSAAALERRRFTIGFVGSTIYARLPELIRAFRQSAPDVELSLVESTTLEQIAALKEGRIDVGFGRIRFEDPRIRRTVLRNERLAVALPRGHVLAMSESPMKLKRVAAEPQILYPRSPRPSYADQIMSHFRDHGLEPRIAHEARELQIAIGLVAAEEGLAIIPKSVSRSRSHDVVYRELVETITSPIIMSHRINDSSPELRLMTEVIAIEYASWGYPVPEALPYR